MKHITATATIAASPETIWAFADDPARYADWVDVTDRVFDTSGGPLRVGYVYHEYGGVPPFKSKSEWIVTFYDPHRRQVHVGDDGMVKTTIELLLDPQGQGTRLSIHITLEPRWYMALPMAILWPLLGRRAQAGSDRTVDNIKRLVEAEQVTTGSM